MADRTVSVRLTAGIAGFSASMGAAKQQVSGLSREMTQAARSNRAEMQTIGTAMTGVGVATLAAMGASAKAAIDFESSFAGVRKTVDASESEFAALEGSFRDLATEIPSSIHEINAVGEAAGQLGIKQDNIVGFTRTMIDLGETTNLSADEAATALARLANVTGMPQDEFDRLGSVIVDLGNNFATTEGEIVEFGQRLAGAGTQIGLTEGEILAIGTALSSVGINAEAGGTAFSKVMINIAQQVETGGDKLATFAEVAGLSVEEFSAAWREDAAGALATFIEGLGAVDAAGGNTFQVLEDLGVTEQRMRDALLRSSGASDVLVDALGRQSSAWEANEALTKEAEQRYGTAAAQIDIAINKITDAAISVGQTLAPAVAEAAGFAGELAETISELPPAAQGAVGVVGTLGGLATTAAGGFLLMAPRIADTRDALASLSSTMPRTVAALGAMKSIIAGPLGIALAGGAVAFGLWAKARQEAEQRIDDMIATLDEETGAITDNTRAHVANRLEQDGLLETAQTLGIQLGDLTGAVLGESDALDRVNSRIGHVVAGHGDLIREGGAARTELASEREAIRQVEGALGGMSAEVSEAQAKKQRLIDATRESATAAADAGGKHGDLGWKIKGAGDAAGDAAPSVRDLAAEQQDAADKTQQHADALNNVQTALLAATDPVFALEQSFRGYRDAQLAVEEGSRAVTEAERELARAKEDLTKVQGDEDASARDLEDAQRRVEEAARRVTDAERDLEDASFDVASATAELEARVLDGGVSYTDFKNKLNDWVSSGKISAGQAEKIRDRVDEMRESAEDVEGEYGVDFDTNAEGIGSQVDSVGEKARRVAGDYSINFRIRTFGSVPSDTVAAGHTVVSGRAHGGPVGPAFSGGWNVVGEDGPELVRFRQPGHVFDAAETRRMMSSTGGGDGASLDYGRLADAVVSAMESRRLDSVSLYRETLRGERHMVPRGVTS